MYFGNTTISPERFWRETAATFSPEANPEYDLLIFPPSYQKKPVNESL